LLGALFSIPGWFFASDIAALFVSGNNLHLLVTDYIAWRMPGLLLYVMIFILRGFFDGMGLTFVGMAAALLSTASNVFFNWVLIYGNFGFPAMGVKGASMASSLSSAPGLIVFLIFIFIFYKTKKYPGVFSSDLKHKKSEARSIPVYFVVFKNLSREVFTISIPTALQEFLMHISFLLFYKIAAYLGPTAMASTNILISLMSLSFMPGMAFGIAATTILGQAMGAFKLKLAVLATHRSVLFASVIMGSLGLLFIFYGKTILGLFTPEESVIEDAYPGLFIISLVQVADAFHMVYGSALRSAGMVYRVMGTYVFANYLVMLPLAYVFGVALDLHTAGLWSAIAVWILFLAFQFFRQFKKGTWKTCQV
jgi:putative MATE family efflux protein